MTNKVVFGSTIIVDQCLVVRRFSEEKSMEFAEILQDVMAFCGPEGVQIIIDADVPRLQFAGIVDLSIAELIFDAISDMSDEDLDLEVDGTDAVIY